MRLKKTVLLVLLSLSIFIWLWSATAVVNVTPYACSLCHGTDARALNASAHKSIACGTCHDRPGALGSVGGQLEKVRMIVTSLTSGYKTPIRAQVDDETCVRCHEKIGRGVTESKGIRMEHASLIEQGVGCLDCHNETAHGSAVPVPRRGTMDKCATCHASKTGEPVRCGTCHLDPTDKKPTARVGTWSAVHDGKASNKHGLGDSNSCSLCHKSSECAECHIQMPHPSTWPSDHGNASSEACTKCHQSSFCDSCHGTEMPHPAGYLKKHSKIVKGTGDRLCYSCHLEVDCRRCHERHVHPGDVKPAEQRSGGEWR